MVSFYTKCMPDFLKLLVQDVDVFVRMCDVSVCKPVTPPRLNNYSVAFSHEKPYHNQLNYVTLLLSSLFHLLLT